MTWFLLLVVVVTVSGAAVKEGTKELAERIVKTEQECTNLKTLKESQSAPYSDLLAICEVSLNQDKYAYIEKNSVDLGQYTGDKFPVTTGQGEKSVKKPPQLFTNEMREKLKDFEDKQNTLAKSSSKQAQDIVDQQVKCALAKAKDDADCMKTLNCKKYRYLTDQKLNLKENSKSFPITYKGKETKINSPPDTARDCDGSSSKSFDETTAATTSDKDKQMAGKQGETGNDDDENNFDELDNSGKETPKIKGSDSPKMVTKGVLDDPMTKLLMGAIGQSLGVKTNDNGMVGNLMTVATPFLSNVIGGGANSALPAPSNMAMAAGNVGNAVPADSRPGFLGAGASSLASLNSNHINSLMKIATNRLRAKDRREKVNREDLRAAVEIVTKTVLHFIILAIQVTSNLGKVGAAPPANQFMENVKIALMDTVAAFLVNFFIDKFLPADEFMTINDVLAANNAMMNNAAAMNNRMSYPAAPQGASVLGNWFGG